MSDPIAKVSPFDAFDPEIVSAEAVGLDAGATLLKLCVRAPAGGLHFATWRPPAHDRARELVDRLGPTHLGVTGCGASALAAAIGRAATSPIEFAAWARGARAMLETIGEPVDAPFLLVSIGTGTSALRVDGDRVERVGGTALGGGAALGLGHALLGARTPGELEALAAKGDRTRVDLMISDLFEDAGAVPQAAVASAFGKLGRHTDAADAPQRPRDEDLAAAVLGIVADNVGLLANAHASAAGVRRIVYGGSTFEVHPRIAETVLGIGAVLGHPSIILPHAGHVGAYGAMLLGVEASAGR